MMSEEQLCRTGEKDPQLPELSKRKRTPSQYASQIATLKNNISPSFKKIRSTKALAPSSANQSPLIQQSNNRLLCRLSSGKTINLKFIFEPNKLTKIDRNNKKKSYKEQRTPEPPKSQNTPAKSQPVNFWDKFLMAFKQIQNKEQLDKEQIPVNNVDIQKQRRQQKIRRQKEREQKWSRSYDRYSQITEKLTKLQDNMFFL